MGTHGDETPRFLNDNDLPPTLFSKHGVARAMRLIKETEE